jgi:hypothetical protein
VLDNWDRSFSEEMIEQPRTATVHDASMSASLRSLIFTCSYE